MKSIENVIQDYFKAWNEGFVSKNGDSIRSFMSREFVGYWAHSKISQPDPYYYSYDLNSVLEQMNDAEKSFEIYSITERNAATEKIVVGRETNVISGQPFSAQCMVIWRKEGDQWKLLREYIELER
ncbi:hypothetical protein FIU87_02955 [Bacillus sp. THAF10]|uniref:nuclear transport factor 2 family protein n=1 Tax=Bacillus sp. THAF10 TaxID=2587848 RepID=UPI0012678DF1|nr:nuclear transport factor 2 family protein [Bacillus sp. THAF10]QFT87599.1 hypothetical protein FIU87_02955 [Bacillus sp. THAF10]